MIKLHQVFVGCPFTKGIRRSYDRLKTELEKETPLHIVLADTAAISSTDYLLESITNLIKDSATCIFDATDNNPNVSLEVGIAHAIPSDYVVALRTRKQIRTTVKGKSKEQIPMKSIISDLQGKMRIEYKTYDKLKDQIVKRHLNNLPYMKRWIDFKKANGVYIPYAIKLFGDIRTSTRTVGTRIDTVLAGSGIKRSDFIKALKKYKLIVAREGKGGGYYYPAK
jgi:hypothetical protein